MIRMHSQGKDTFFIANVLVAAAVIIRMIPAKIIDGSIHDVVSGCCWQDSFLL